ncbi:MAG: SagB/ThcOx family dehydrogenase [Chloroflexota bacterium]|nr:MAG: SagB/ThcOx family dehydrogenase [Chloroflexota bacterium]
MPKSKRELLKANEWGQADEWISDQQKGMPRPDIQKPVPPGAALVDLIPPEQFTIGRAAVIDVIRERISHRVYSEQALTLEELSFLLWATQGVREKVTEDGITYVMRNVPSGGNRHPMETYLSIHRVEGIQPGLYRYLPIDHLLVQEKEDRSLPEQVNRASLYQDSGSELQPYYFIKEAAVVFIWVAIPYRSEWRYHRAAARLIALDAGHVCQNLYIAAGAIGAGTCAVGAFDQAKMNEVVGANGEEEFVLYMAPVGKIGGNN